MNASSPNDAVIWKIISKYFEDNPQCLVSHHIDSYNDFFNTGIFQIFKDKNVINLTSVYDNDIKEYKHQCNLYFGGKDGKLIYFGKPVIYDEENAHYMYPNEARLRNMNYSMTIHYDIEVEFIDILKLGETPYIVGGDDDMDGGDAEAIVMTGGEYPIEMGGAPKPPVAEKGKAMRQKRGKSVIVEQTPSNAKNINEQTQNTIKETTLNSTRVNIQKRTLLIEKVYLGKFPIMVQSNHCILNGFPREMQYNLGECRNDYGGYFIIDGKEKVVVPQEKFGDNIMYIRKSKGDSDYLYSAEIRSVSENVSKPIRTLSIRILSPQKKYTFENIVVFIPNVRSPIPIFILFRALGIISDKDIITMCLLDLEKYEDWMDMFIPSIHDAGGIMTQTSAIMYIATFTKYNKSSYVMQILSDYFLPHLGELNFIQKAYYLGHMVFRLLSVCKGIEPPTDRDNYKYKRIELVGSLLNDLFREFYTLQQKAIHLGFEKRLYYNRDMYESNLYDLIQNNHREVFQERIVELGIRKAFKGDWGAVSHTKRVGVVQDLNRLSYNTMISHMRKTNLPLDAGVKLVEPRVLHCSQWGFIDPIDTPDGANIGLHKTFAITTFVSRGQSREPIIQWMRENLQLKWVEECSPPSYLSSLTKVFVNGYWAGAIDNPIESVNKMRFYRRNALLPIHTSITFDIKHNTVFIYNDAGRVCRPIFYRDPITSKFSIENRDIISLIEKDEFQWSDLTTGFNKKKDIYDANRIYQLGDLYDKTTGTQNPMQLERFIQYKAVIDYIDPSESENALIALNLEELSMGLGVIGDTGNEKKNKSSLRQTHLEIHESLLFGVMCNQIIFPEHNPPTRNAFSCGQSRQAVSMYHTNYQVRMDKTAVVLHYGQIPIVKSRYMEYINNEENPYGINAIVAVMCYSGYNVEDAILINEGALKRGIFNNTYYTMYETHEETTKSVNVKVNKRFMNIEQNTNVVGTKPGYDYSKLDDFGMIRENVGVTDKTVLIGLTAEETGGMKYKDMSKTPKKGQIGVVDKSFMTEGDEGQRIAKVRIREVRIPNIGDKFAGRAGQKGTIGLVIPEENMPFNADGMRPDLIINPHALPSRMTIGQLIECVFGKAAAIYGGFGDCTAFVNRGTKLGIVGEHLTKVGFHSSGNEIFYNGMTGEQIETEIFVGPTYYMRLKHMVKDKINYRASGPRTALTRQPVSGRANDGGLRIGEMERDVLISHGISDFLRESMMERGDKFHMAICNKTGGMAIYNPAKDLFLSPLADGPVQFSMNLLSNGDTATPGIGQIENELNGMAAASRENGSNFTIHNVTKFGREFSIVEIPYSFKLLLQELQTMNIHMRIITEDNIDQLEHMSFSKNIDLLSGHKTNMKYTLFTLKRTIAELREEHNKKQLFPTIFEDDEYEKESVASTKYESSNSIPMAPDKLEIEDIDMNSFPLYSPTSPAFIPGTSFSDKNLNLNEINLDKTTESISQNQSGGEVGTSNYQIGDVVYYRGLLGGSNKHKHQPPVEYIVKDIGSQFITMANSDANAVRINPTDNIHVVSPEDIINKNDVIYAEEPYPPSYMQPYPPVYGEPMPQPTYPNTPPTIDFHPVIKFVQGNDNTTNAGSSPSEFISSESDLPNSINSETYSIPTINTRGGSSNNNPDSTTVSVGGTATPSAISGGDFVIKKLS